ncbi:metallophosphoesterase [Lentzea tibetensis]|uniref:metallophosphoesterase n=1 Tax=Lentzea tibetensis TaxID=2591470 RepID=UPI00164681E6|nr:metallophosphoesterase [Lentzea tibetensis]
MIVLAHLSDVHLDGGDRAADRAARTMAYLNDLHRPVDAVLVTGDIADHGLAEEYRQAAKILSSPHPVLTCPGNHDVRAPFREFLLGEAPDSSPVNRVHRVGDVVIALCDSSIPGRDDGFLADETIDWLDSVLPSDGPSLVCFHHPPVELHHPVIDGIRQHGEDRLAALVDRHPSIAGFLCGHAHTPAASTFAGRPLLVAPGVVSTMMLPWEGEGVLNFDSPPAVAFHVLDERSRLTTHFRYIA